MIKFDRLWETMERKQVAKYWLREKCGIDRKTIRKLVANENIETKTLNKICTALDCALEDIAQYVADLTETLLSLCYSLCPKHLQFSL